MWHRCTGYGVNLSVGPCEACPPGSEVIDLSPGPDQYSRDYRVSCRAQLADGGAQTRTYGFAPELDGGCSRSDVTPKRLAVAASFTPDVTTPGYDGWPLVMLRLEQVDADRLEELITDAWRMRSGS